MNNIYDKDYKIPWNEKDFSERMLKFHLSEDHDMASRRSKRILKHIDFLHNVILNARKSNILDVCCGPGLYLNKLAKLGHIGSGYDFSPASIEYALLNKSNGISFYLSDILQNEFKGLYDLCIFLYGEFNVFSPKDIVYVLNNIFKCLRPRSQLLIEIQKYDYVKSLSEVYQKKTLINEDLLFSDRPYYQSIYSIWDNSNNISIQTYEIDQGEENKKYNIVTKAYTKKEITEMLISVGFADVKFTEKFGEDVLDHFWLVSALKK